eukprot:9357345-Ditylum_brightwellii.AAC.1
MLCADTSDHFGVVYNIVDAALWICIIHWHICTTSFENSKHRNDLAKSEGKQYSNTVFYLHPTVLQ